MMVRLQVQLTETQVQALKRMAAEQGVSIAELIRRGVDRQLGAEPLASRREHLKRLKERVRKLDIGIRDLSEEHDRYLAEAYAHDDDLR